MKVTGKEVQVGESMCKVFLIRENLGKFENYQDGQPGQSIV